MCERQCKAVIASDTVLTLRHSNAHSADSEPKNSINCCGSIACVLTITRLMSCSMGVKCLVGRARLHAHLWQCRKQLGCGCHLFRNEARLRLLRFCQKHRNAYLQVGVVAQGTHVQASFL